MNRAHRRATAKAERLAATRHHRQPRIESDDLRLAVMPWKIRLVFDPVEAIIDRIARDGTIDCAQGEAVFLEDSSGGWFETVPALEGIISYHQIAARRYGWEINITPLERIANKLRLDSPITHRDIEDARGCISNLKKLIKTLTLRQAKQLLTDAKIGWEIEDLIGKAA